MEQKPFSGNASVTPRTIENIKGDVNHYVQIETPKGKVIISIGEKNHKLLTEILTK